MSSSDLTTDISDAPGAAGSGGATGSGGAGAGASAHVLLRLASAVEDALERGGGAAAWSMTPAEQAETLRTLHRVEARVAELRLRVLVAADRNQVGTGTGATSTAAWVAAETHRTRAECARDLRLAEHLDGDFTATAAALRAGRIEVEQARVVIEAVQRLTDEHDQLPDGTQAKAEAHLLDAAESFDAVALRRLGKRLFEVVCAVAADHAEGQLLAAEEERARRLARLSLHDLGDGTVAGSFRLPVLHADLLKKALEALTSPRRLGQGRLDPATGRKLDYTTLLGHGFMELLEHHLDTTTLPTQQGSPFTLVVTLGLDALRSGLGVATLDTDTRISAGAARRLGCTAGLIPMVLGGDSMPLDLGRESRLFSKHQRLALAHTHGGCATTGCDRPPSWTEAHHSEPWVPTGPTDLANGLPLCPAHHRMAHDPHWRLHRLPTGAVRFTRRQ